MTSTDERRARAILADYQEFVCCVDDECQTCLEAVRTFVRAIRESDEAALTPDQWDELDALAKSCATFTKLGLQDGCSALHRSHWRGTYDALVRAGYVTWGRWPKEEWSSKYAKVKPTEKGISALRARGEG